MSELVPKKMVGGREPSHCFALLCGLTFFLWSCTAFAEPQAVQVDPLDFGSVAFVNNTSMLSYELRTSGQVSLDAGLVIIDPGIPARFELSGFPVNKPLKVTMGAAALTQGGAGLSETLTVSELSVTGATTNSLGEAILTLGATLKTSGSGVVYPDGPYLPSSTITLQVQYWAPDFQAFVTESFPIEIRVLAKTGIEFEELQPLSFGTLFARSDSVDPARLTVKPSGDISIDEPGDSRLVSISRPSPGIFRVSGAAPNYWVTISLQQEDVELILPQGGPRFIIKDFKSSPDGAGRINELGILEFSVGASLYTEVLPAGGVYPSGAYTGNYSVTVSY